MVTHSGDGDTFWDIVQKGARQAAAKDNVDFLYAHSDQGQEQAQLVDAYVAKKRRRADRHPRQAGGAQGVRRPRGRAAGIPVVTVNSGSEQSAAFGALTHIGQDETVAGRAVGDALDERPQEGAVRPARAGQRRPRAALRRHPRDLRRRAAEPVRRRHQHARRHGVHRGQAPDRPGPGRRRHPRRALRRRRRPGQAHRPERRRRSPPSTSTPRSPPPSAAAPSPSPSTSSRTSRATRPWTCCGSTATTPTSSAAAAPSSPARRSSRRSDAAALAEYTERGTR